MQSALSLADFFGVAFVAALSLLGVLAFGGRMHYWQTFSVVAYVSLPVTVIQKANQLPGALPQGAGGHSSDCWDRNRWSMTTWRCWFRRKTIRCSTRSWRPRHPCVVSNLVDGDGTARGRLQSQFDGGLGRDHYADSSVPAVGNGDGGDLPELLGVSGKRQRAKSKGRRASAE